MKTSRGRRGRASHVDMIPMIDIVFQLILFFLVSTTFVMLPGIAVQLPESTTSEGGQTGGLVITLSAQGEVWLNEELVNQQELDSRLASFSTGGVPRGEYPVQLEADAMVPNGRIVQLFDILRRNGFASVNLRTVED